MYYQALLHTPTTGRNTRKLSYRDTAAITSLDKTGKQYWQQAIDYYQKNLIHKDLLFDNGMVRVKDILEDQESRTDLKEISGLPTDWQSLLIAVASSYKKHFWKAQDQLNRCLYYYPTRSYHHFGDRYRQPGAGRPGSPVS